jgi:hypothetical protein
LTVGLVHAACIHYQIILHGSDVASLCRFMNAALACNVSSGSSLRTGKA